MGQLGKETIAARAFESLGARRRDSLESGGRDAWRVVGEDPDGTGTFDPPSPRFFVSIHSKGS